MQIKELLYKTPEMTEEKLLEIIKSHLNFIEPEFKKRLQSLHKYVDLEQAFLNEYDLINEKKSFLTRSQRDQILGYVGMCLIEMTKKDEN